MNIYECTKCEYNEEVITASEHYLQCDCLEYNTTFPEFNGNCPHFKERNEINEESI